MLFYYYLFCIIKEQTVTINSNISYALLIQWDIKLQLARQVKLFIGLTS